MLALERGGRPCCSSLTKPPSLGVLLAMIIRTRYSYGLFHAVGSGYKEAPRASLVSPWNFATSCLRWRQSGDISPLKETLA